MKIKISILLYFLFYIVNSSSQLSPEAACDLAKKSFKLTDKDRVEVLEISLDSYETGVLRVKYKINDVEVYTRMKKYDKGWQLEGVRTDYGMWLDALWINDLVEQSDNIARAKTEISSLARYLDEYLLDNAALPNQAGSYNKNSLIYKALCPSHAASIPIKDPWGSDYLIFCGTRVNGHYGISGSAAEDYLIISLGRDGKAVYWNYEIETHRYPKLTSWMLHDPNDDIINLNRIFIRGLIKDPIK
ncbi:MAG: hypothetical protein NTU60_09745 [Candidatus Aminicenantes bacterium]|nr:hypothetical protein [Candidatus Aminicenantes bacterium]